MEEGYGSPPKSGWAPLVCELLVEDIQESTRFWTQILGFEVAYGRSDPQFVYLERPEGGQVMLCQRWGKWETGPMDRPFGRGVMFQVRVTDLDAVLAALKESGHPVYEGPREVWRRTGDREGGAREVFVQDPNGYLVMLSQGLGERPISPLQL